MTKNLFIVNLPFPVKHIQDDEIGGKMVSIYANCKDKFSQTLQAFKSYF